MDDQQLTHRILQAGEVVYGRYGEEHGTVEAIAAQAECSEDSIRDRFTDDEALFTAVWHYRREAYCSYRRNVQGRLDEGGQKMTPSKLFWLLTISDHWMLAHAVADHGAPSSFLYQTALYPGPVGEGLFYDRWLPGGYYQIMVELYEHIARHQDRSLVESRMIQFGWVYLRSLNNLEQYARKTFSAETTPETIVRALRKKNAVNSQFLHRWLFQGMVPFDEPGFIAMAEAADRSMGRPILTLPEDMEVPA